MYCQLEADNWVLVAAMGTSSNRPGYVNFNKATNPYKINLPWLNSSVLNNNSAMCTYSDENGNLLFSADGGRAYDRRHYPMTGSFPPLIGEFLTKGTRYGTDRKSVV